MAMNSAFAQQAAAAEPVQQTMDGSTNMMTADDEIALLRKRLQIAETQRMLDQLALAGPKTEMEILQEQFEKLQLQLKISEMRDQLGSMLILL